LISLWALFVLFFASLSVGIVFYVQKRSVADDFAGSVSTGGGLIELHFDGVIFDGAPQLNRIVNQLHEIARNKSAKGILLKINSPGGSVAATQVFLEALQAVKKAGIKVVVLVTELCASGGYYVSSHADSIITYPGSAVGSIGVIIEGLGIKELLKKIGVEPRVIKSGEYKDLFSMYRDLTKSEVKFLQNLVDDTMDQFVEAVVEGRTNMSSRHVRRYADGRIWNGRQALRIGLIDGTGGRKQALSILWDLTGVEEGTNPKRKRTFIDFFMILEGSSGGASTPLSTPKFPVMFMYPGALPHGSFIRFP